MNLKRYMQSYIRQEIKTLKKLNLDEINDAANAIVDCRNRDGIVYTMGNGGSAATASHFVCDFAKGLSENVEGQKFKFECLCDNTPLFMAIGNDIGYDEVFRFQLKDKLTENDLVLAISGSGNSQNIINACKYAKEVGAKIIGISGYDGGELYQISDYHMHAPIDDMQIAEDIHMIFDHMLLRVITQCTSEK